MVQAAPVHRALHLTVTTRQATHGKITRPSSKMLGRTNRHKHPTAGSLFLALEVLGRISRFTEGVYNRTRRRSFVMRQTTSVASPTIFIWAADLRHRSSPMGSRGEAPVGGRKTKSLRSWSSLQIWYCLQILCRNDQNLKFFAQFTPWFLTSLFHGGAKATFCGP